MRRIMVLMAMAAAALSAQQSEPFRYNGDFYAFFTGGTCQHGFGFSGVGLGAEGFVFKGLSVGVEASGNQFVDSYAFGIVSLQLGYHFVPRDRPSKWDPFISFGPGFGFAGGGMARSGNAGGGVTYWFKRRIGLRAEFRTQIVGEEVIPAGRIGVAFR